jgi:putative transposase
MAKYQNKYCVESARAGWWDYGSPGAYFITICTADRRHYFGEIRDGVMHLSHVGVIADILWYEIPHHAKNVELGVFVVMPNHLHGILILNGDGGGGGNVGRDRACPVSTGPTDTPRRPPISKPGQKHRFVHYRIVQIGRDQTHPAFGV